MTLCATIRLKKFEVVNELGEGLCICYGEHFYTVESLSIDGTCIFLPKRKSINLSCWQVGMKSISHLMQLACKAFSMIPEESILPLVEYSGNETLLKNIELSEMEELGLEMSIRYGNSLR